jgi:hypothetical protein
VGPQQAPVGPQLLVGGGGPNILQAQVGPQPLVGQGEADLAARTQPALPGGTSAIPTKC